MANEQLRLIDLLDDLSEGKETFFQSVRFVKDIMTTKVKSLTLDDTVETALNFFIENKVRHIPVFSTPSQQNPGTCLIGIVSQRDVFRQISPFVKKIGQTDSDATALKQPLLQILSRNPLTVPMQAHITRAIKIMIDNRIDSVLVLAEKKLMGIITSADILKVFVRLDAVFSLCRKIEKKSEKKRFIDLLSDNVQNNIYGITAVLKNAQDIMVDNVKTLTPDSTIVEAMNIMRSKKFRHIPVVQNQNILLGIISDRDILKNLPFHQPPFKPQDKVFRERLFNLQSDNKVKIIKLRQIMTKSVITVSPESDFYSAVHTMHEKNISSLPVVDQQKKLLGIITATDIMRALLAVFKLFEKSPA